MQEQFINSAQVNREHSVGLPQLNVTIPPADHAEQSLLNTRR